jgi:hypothetical protein
MGMPQSERLIRLNQMAIRQMRILTAAPIPSLTVNKRRGQLE